MAKVFHDSGYIRYWGDQFRLSDTYNHQPNVIYISPEWMISVMRGLIRCDRQSLVDFAISYKENDVLYYSKMLNFCGMLHSDLQPFFWPSQKQSSRYWSFVRKNLKGSRESELWPENIVENEAEMHQALELLGRFDLVAKVGLQYVAVPGLLPPSEIVPVSSMIIPQCPFWFEFKYHSMIHGAFECIVVRNIRKYCDRFNFTSSTASFYDASMNIAQLIYHTKRLKENCAKEHIFVLRSSSPQMLADLQYDIEHMNERFPGLTLAQNPSEGVYLDYFYGPGWFRWHPPLVGNIFVMPRHEYLKDDDEVPCAFCPTKQAYKFRKSQLRMDRNPTRPTVTCRYCDHEHFSIDLETTFEISATCICPCCQEHGERIPGTFDASRCRLLLNQCSIPSSATITCFKCLENSRLGQIRILDLFPPEIYVSGFTILTSSVQALVSNFLHSLQVEAEVLCTHILDEKDDEQSRRSSLELASFVICFLTDQYFRDPKCREELCVALKSKKRILPVIMPNFGQDSEQSVDTWSGSREIDYIKDARGLCRASSSESLKNSSDWDWMKYFPIFNLEGFPADDMVRRVAMDVKSHLRRPGVLAAYPDFSLLGVKVSYFDRFIKRYGRAQNPRSTFEGLTTSAVMKRFVCEATKKSKLSFCEYLRLGNDHDLVGTATVFYSHAWSYLFLDVVDAIKQRFQESHEDPVIWFDVFSVSQHKTDNKPFEWWNIVFLNAVGEIGRVIMLIQPFESVYTRKTGEEERVPAWITLKRVWCVFELFACESTKSHFEVIMTKGMSERLHEAVANKSTDFFESLLSIQCEQSEATNKEDKERVFDLVRRTIGFSALNLMVVRVIEKCIYSSLLTWMAKISKNTRTNILQFMLKLHEKAHEPQKMKLGDQHPDTIHSEEILICLETAIQDETYLEMILSKGIEALTTQDGLKSGKKNQLTALSSTSTFITLRYHLSRLFASYTFE